MAGGAREYEPRVLQRQEWIDRCIGACATHSWTRTGCWFSSYGSRRSVACSALHDEHLIWDALAALDDEPARGFARRFAGLDPARQVELWRKFNWLRLDPADPGQASRAFARAAALVAGWEDTAAAWPE